MKNMSVLKCKMCGGTLEISSDQTTAVCEYCGTKQTLPRLDSERLVNLYDRASHFRRNNEFDKAMSIYELILNEDGTDAEAYWSLVLCRYGIEYVEDPATHRRVPTVNRAQYTSVFDDDNYKSALKYADENQRVLYEAEAAEINRIQKGILEISKNEEPFDIFICYKETDAAGGRTEDSVLAYELYDKLTKEGFKVFFARVTLEDKLGEAYEPYIFAALNSAKVMIVVGTRAEYINAVWVKNEWSRYLTLVGESGGKKTLIPAYKGMDPYDLPEEFSHLQGQDMGKLGAMQDMVRGVKKIIGADTVNLKAQGGTNAGQSVASEKALLERTAMALEDGDWDSANQLCERVLDINPQNAEAYLGKLMVDLRCRRREDLQGQSEPFDNNSNYIKIIKFGNDGLKSEIKQRNFQIMASKVYERAKKKLLIARTSSDFASVSEMYESISNYMDSKERAQNCRKQAEVLKKDEIYQDAAAKQSRNTIDSLIEASKVYRTIPGWRDADSKALECEKKVEYLKADDEWKKNEAENQRELQRELKRQRLEKSKKKKRKIAVISISLIIYVIVLIIVINVVV